MAAFSYFTPMIRRLLLLVLSIFIFSATYAQQDTSRLRISLLTCGTGPETWETFGHTAVRVVDSNAGTDIVFNYGSFAFDDDFAIKFARGKLLYYVSYYAYEVFLDEYQYANRSVSEQLLLLDRESKVEFYDFLLENSKEENRYYLYDFFFDNCATRIRDIFPKVLGPKFEFGKTVAAREKISFREMINVYYAPKHWERFGINLLLGSRIDVIMTNEDLMFLPDYLSEAIANATLDGESISTQPKQVLPGGVDMSIGVNQPFLLMSFLALLTILGLSVPSLKALGKVMTFLMLFITGLLGCLMVVMWLGTDHQGCQNNFNLLWALPTNLFLAFVTKKNKSRYALVAIILMVVVLFFHVFSIQGMLFIETAPLLLALLFIYGNIYRKRSRGYNDGQPQAHTN